MTRNSIRIVALGFASVLMVGAMGISPAWAYFTDSTRAAGGIRIGVEPSTDIEEEFDYNGKHVYIKNTSDSVPVFVRAKVYTNKPQHLAGIGGDNWTSGDEDWWYYDKVLEPGSETDELLVEVAYKTADKTVIVNADGTTSEFINETHEGENFNVIVVYEAVPIQFDSADNPLTPQVADWQMAWSE